MATDKAKQGRAHQAAQGQSGLSAAAYCPRHGLSYASWMYWQRRLGSAGLVPIMVAPSHALPSVPSFRVELTLPGGVSLRVSGAGVADWPGVCRAELDEVVAGSEAGGPSYTPGSACWRPRPRRRRWPSG